MRAVVIEVPEAECKALNPVGARPEGADTVDARGEESGSTFPIIAQVATFLSRNTKTRLKQLVWRRNYRLSNSSGMARIMF